MNARISGGLSLLHEKIAHDGFVFAPAMAMRRCLRQFGELDDWNAFVDSWNDLALDTYLIAHGRYRRRRHAVFVADADGANGNVGIHRAAHQPHFQSSEYNPLQGDIERWFEPIRTEIGEGDSLRTILRSCCALFGEMATDVRVWRVEVHQFRIEARPDEPGQPTPEGVHRDGVDYVLVLMIRRTNIAQGTTTIHARDGQLLGSFTLTDPLDAALVDDARVCHGVTAVEPIDAAKPAFRDVLVVTFKRAGG